LRQGSKHRRAARVKRRKKQLAQLVGADVALSIFWGDITAADGVKGLAPADRARALVLVEQLQAETSR